MSKWREVYSRAGFGYPVNDKTHFEEDVQMPGRFRMTWELNGQKVSHTFNMAQKWEKRFGSLPYGL